MIFIIEHNMVEIASYKSNEIFLL